MKFYVSQEVLAKALDIAARAISSRSSLPILGNYLLEAVKDQLVISATDRTISIRLWVKAEVEEQGSITLPSRLLREFVHTLPDEQVLFDLNDRTKTASVRTQRNSATIKGLDAAEYPLIENKQALNIQVDFDRVMLLDMIDGVAFCASEDASKPTMCSVQCLIENGSLLMAATDGYRLAVRRSKAHGTKKQDLIIPAASLNEVAKLAIHAEGETIPMTVDKNGNASFCMVGKGEIEKMLITLSVLDARFPDYWAIVPQSPTTVCTVETKVFENVLKVATIFARENANIVYLTIKPADNQIIVTAKSADNGDTSCELPAEEINGPGLEIAFNVGYLKQMLTHINDSKLKIELTQTTRPGRFYAASEERENCIYVIMPMHPPR